MAVQPVPADSCGNHICENFESGLPCEPQWGPDCVYCAEDCDYCTDTDPEVDIFTKGIVIFNWNEKIEDVCTKDTEIGRSRNDLTNNLGEAFCAGDRGPNTGGAGGKSIECEFGCEDGACLRSKPYFPLCIDTESGKNTEVQGTTKFHEFESRDACIDATRGSVRE
ncbi:hypothetical protein HYU13_01195 [Candidatus Woesearchaeota archaeon]|nr:hypothetical protein [Candidatus Woesearchaeota archaeon]